MLTPKQTQEILSKLCHRPRKKLGQNFLIDPNITLKSLKNSKLKNLETVIEVGPGLGTLTETMLQKGAEVFAVEYDKTLYDFLKAELLPKFPKKFHLVHADAVDIPLAGLNPSGPFKIIANLPYAISSPWLAKVLDGPLPEVMVLMLQKEAADRFYAQVGTKNFGALTIFLQSAYDCTEVHKVSKTCFYPQPQVDSALITLSKKKNPITFPPEAKRLISTFFTQRRKQIQNLINQHKDIAGLQKWIEYLQSQGLPSQSRPEQIPLNIWQTLPKYL